MTKGTKMEMECIVWGKGHRDGCDTDKACLMQKPKTSVSGMKILHTRIILRDEKIY